MVSRTKSGLRERSLDGAHESRVRVVFDNRLRVRATDLPVEVRDELRARFSYENPERRKLAQLERAVQHARGGQRGKLIAMLNAVRKAPRTIETWAEDDRDEPWISIPRGGLAWLEEALAPHGGFAVEDRRALGFRREGNLTLEVRPGEQGGLVVEHSPGGAGSDGELWDFQAEMVDAAVEAERCVLRAPTASGKTTAGLALAARLGLSTLVVVDRQALLDQWVSRAEKEFGLEPGEVGVIQGARRRLAPFTVGMMQTLVAHLDGLERQFGLVIADECHKCGARTFVDVVDRLAAKYVVGISDDERRKDGREFLVYDQFGDVALQVDEDDLIAKRRVLDPEVRMLPTEFDAPWYARLPGGDRGFYQDRLLDEMTCAEDRTEVAVRASIAEVAGGEQVVVLADRVEHVRRIQAKAAELGEGRSGLLLGGPEMKAEYARTSRGILAGDVRLGVGTYQAGGTGMDWPRVTRGVLASPAHMNKTKFRQARGRFCRATGGKADAALYVLWDVKVFGLAPLRRMLEWNNRVLVRTEDGGFEDGRETLRRMRDAEDRSDEGGLFDERNGTGG